MKRKFILYPAVALALMTSASLSSCVDTDEPESLEALRNAKAEEVRANAGLINAKTAVENAYVAVVNANARKAEADAAYSEYVALLKKQEQELDAIKKKIEGDVENATAQQQIDEAKAKWDAKIADAKASYEAKNALFQKAAEDAKFTAEKARVEVKRDLAKLANEGSFEGAADGELIAKADAYADALDALATAQENLANCFKDNYEKTGKLPELEGTALEKKFELDKAVADTVQFATFMAEKNIAGFGELYQDYQKKFNAVEAEKNKLTAKQQEYQDVIDLELQPAKNKTAEALTAANKKYDETKAAKEKGFQDEIDKLNTTKQKLSFSVTNPSLQAEIGTVTGFTYKDQKYTSDAEFEGQKLEEGAKAFKTKVESIKNDLLSDYSRKFNALVKKAAANEAKAKTTRDNAVKAWKDAITAMKGKENTDKADVVKDKAVELFGSFAAGDNWKYFTNASAYTSDKKDMEKLLIATGKFGDKIEWKNDDSQGAYGNWAWAAEAADINNINNIVDNATELLKVVTGESDGQIKKYKDELKKQTDGKAGVAKTDEMTKLDEAKKAAKAADDAAQKALDDQNDKIKKEVTEELTKITIQAEKDKNLADLYFNWAKQIESKTNGKTLDDQERTDLFDLYVGYAKDYLNNAVAKAQDAYDEAAKDVADYKAGTYDPDKKVKGLQDKVDEKQKAADKAKREYDNLVEYYK